MAGGEFLAAGLAMMTAFLWPGAFLNRALRDYFTRPEGPWNLAIFRILFFFTFAKAAIYLEPWIAGMPAHFRVPPPGYSFWMPWIPFEYETYLIAQGILFAACVMAMLGLWTRFFVVVAAVLGIYVLGLPNFFGRINHGGQHLIWFSIIFACSRCSDVLSVDAALAAWRKGRFRSPEPSLAYALPLRFMGLLLALIYFTSGIWKMVKVGWDWIFSNNLIWILQTHWLRKGFVPAFRLDHYPQLCHAAALAVIVFEMGFLFLILFPRLRLPAVLAAIVFHKTTAYFMKISFNTLQSCLPLFIDWEYFLKKAGAFVSGHKGGFEPQVPVKLLAVLRSLDAAQFMRPPRESELETPFRPAFPKAVLAAGSLILCVQIFCGAVKFNSWPFSIYPVFAFKSQPYLDRVYAQAVFGREVQTIPIASLLSSIHDVRWSSFSDRILRTEDEGQRRFLLMELTRYLLQLSPELAAADEIRYSKARYAVAPEKWPQNPVAVSGLAAITHINLKERTS